MRVTVSDATNVLVKLANIDEVCVEREGVNMVTGRVSVMLIGFKVVKMVSDRMGETIGATVFILETVRLRVIAVSGKNSLTVVSNNVLVPVTRVVVTSKNVLVLDIEVNMMEF